MRELEEIGWIWGLDKNLEGVFRVAYTSLSNRI